jgi:hypothetical protein
MKQLHTLVPFFRRACPQFVHDTQMHYDCSLARARLIP